MNTIIGLARLAIGRADGMARFRDTKQAFLSSLAPLLAFPLVGALLLAATKFYTAAAATVLLAVIAQLMPPVLSYWMAVRWGREAEWLRFSTAYNWCQWAIPLAFMALLVVTQFGVALGISEAVAEWLLVTGLAVYSLWLHWTVARHGLSLSWWRAAVLVLVVNGLTMMMTSRLITLLLRALPLQTATGGPVA